jgi:cell division protease FtsH
VEDRNYSEKAAQQIDQEIRRLVDECYERAREILKAQRPALDHVVQALLQRETIDGAELDRLIEEAMGTPPTLAVAA